MGKELKDIAKDLKNKNKKVQLIYAFNGTGKTRLSRAFKEEIFPSRQNDDSERGDEKSRDKFLYYNAFTEDLFYWDNDLIEDSRPKLRIQPNTFTGWLIDLLKELGEDGNIATNFQRYTGSKATPIFNEKYKTKIDEKEITIPAFSEVTFQVAANEPVSYEAAIDATDDVENVVQGKYEIIKISKGEESNFVWSVMYTLLQQVISTLNEQDTTNRITDKFDALEYVFIDDPVSSLDDTHLIELAVDLANLIKRSYYFEGCGLRFVITTHSPLFYNVLHNELNNDLKNPVEGKSPAWLYKRDQSEKHRLVKNTDVTFDLSGSNDHPFSYHLFLLSEIREAIKHKQVRKYHFSFMRNILEKTATFLGHPRWEDLLIKTAEGSPDPFLNRILNLASHSAHAGEEITDIEEKDKENLEALVNHLFRTYGFKKQE
ncbi:AAA family ATPase [Kordiimonas sp.]|uniref:AAA family ATPase n=1 Tax=Kordiimonas sp. TaxID=1970157 RepID=UPI003A8DCCF8|tara:strand:- start:190 stop:1479 length:1290 start_codon:yes stop_codon:yes gene_type:complete